MRYRVMLLPLLLLYVPSLFARPTFAETLALSHSVVMITTELPNAQVGRGSGVVVSKEYVATNCHVIANAEGANIAKFRKGYKPIAIKANWKQDLCLLKFDELPFKPVNLRDSATLQYEEAVFSLSFPRGQNVPQPSYGNVKATYPYEDSFIVRSSAQFHLGSSGGALFDEQFNLIGISTFKSPGKGYYYHLPVEWIKTLMEAPETQSLSTNVVPFWALPLAQRPAFMRVVIPYKNENWDELSKIAEQWTKEEPQSADAWYYLGVAEEGKGNQAKAKIHLTKALALNARDLDAMLALSRVAYAEKDIQALEALEAPIRELDHGRAEMVVNHIRQLNESECTLVVC